MSRTKRYVPHYVIRDALHPYIDPTTGKEYVWGSPERQQYHKQREASNLRGQDGRHRHSEHWGYRWMEPMDAIRTGYRRLINEGIADHFDALEDHGKIFDWRGYEADGAEIWYEEMAAEYEYLRRLEELEEIEREEEHERRYAREMDDYYDHFFEEDFFY